MSAPVVLGQSGLHRVHLDLPRLVDTRLLVQANSGGGKSWVLRRLLEQTHGHLQHLVIDPEGEFASLRERYDYVLAAKGGGDTAADPRSARLLAERLLELGVSAILDIYELKAPDRIRFVKEFLEAVVDAPKKLWHPALVVVDEAHVFCPEQGRKRGKGDSESAGAVIDLATRGRKRGFTAVLATQRLAKLHKDAAAELNNVLVGRTGLDVDVRRAAEVLGFGRERWRELRQLSEGHFFAFGPAISREVMPVHIGPVSTTHPKAGARLAFTAPPPTEKVRALLPRLADLPAAAEQRQRSLDDLRQENARLKREVAAAEKRAPAPPEPVVVERPVLAPDQVERLEQAIQRLLTGTATLTDQVAQRQQMVVAEAGTLRNEIRAAFAAARHQQAERGNADTGAGRPAAARPVRPAPAVRPRPAARGESAAAGLDKAQRAILVVLAQHPDGCERGRLTLLTGYRWTGGFRNALSGLRTLAYIEGANDAAMRITDDGLVALGAGYEPLPIGQELRDYWLNHKHFGKCERAILEALFQAHPDGLDIEGLTEATGYRWTGGFRNSLSALRTAGILEGKNTEVMRAAGHLFEEGA